MRVSLIACVGALALLTGGVATAQDKAPVLLFNFLNEPVTVKFDDGQSCAMKSGQQNGECSVSLTPGRHEVKIQGKGTSLSATIQVQAGDNEYWVTAAGVKRQ